MAYSLIRHKVGNYAKWKRVVKEHAKWRKQSGEKCFFVCRGDTNPNDLLVWCEWRSAATMKKFLRSAKLRQAMRQCGVIGKPEISFWGQMENLSAR